MNMEWAIPKRWGVECFGTNQVEPTEMLSTFRDSTGRVTLNLSMVLTTMAGVVRKKRRMKRKMLSSTNRIHHDMPRTDKFSLQERKCMKDAARSEGHNAF